MPQPKSERSARLDFTQALARLPLFLELSEEQIAALAADTREKRLEKGATLFQKGDEPKGFFVVIFGQIKLALPSPQGTEKVVDIVGPYQTFGEAVMFMNKPYPVFAEALDDTLLLHIGKTTVFELLERDSSFARAMLAGLSRRLRSLISDVEAYSLRSSVQRVIGYLLQQCDDNVLDSPVEIALPTSKQVIASRLNLTPETLSRIFHDLSEAGLVTVHGKQITIHAVRRLREFEL